MRWVAGITTCMRPMPCLDYTIKSLAESGFSPVVVRHEADGAWSNFHGLMSELINYPADMYLVCQDDIEVAKNLRAYLEQVELPSGICSLYRQATASYSDKRWVATPKGSTYGALALVFRPSIVQRFLECKFRMKSQRQVDIKLGHWCYPLGITFWTHNPSLVRHTGMTSVIHPGMKISPSRQCGEYCDDAASLLTQLPV